mgnify:CR=1 FL=1
MLKDTFTFQGPLGEIECLVEPNRSENMLYSLWRTASAAAVTAADVLRRGAAGCGACCRSAL